MHTLTEENYLKAIYRIYESTGDSVSTTAIAEKLQINAASVTDMFKKLGQQKLVVYEKSRGVKPTDKGKKVALQILRKHRLWETFMVEKLKFSWDEVHEVAEQLEHVHSDILIERLDQLLGYPKFDPHGDPIPDKNGKLPAQVSILLSQGKIGHPYRISGVSENTDAFLKYLNKIGLAPGSHVSIVEIEEFDGSMKLSIDNKKEIILSRQAAENLSVVS
ncbi:metal-dependent transcriptional regulator [Chryseolinea sp. T2]|uniref:metal-dependent transcriptional regulator n=1 Tax=Chryseolinea sp. T2 TaxID=3129255 RepID=UPI003076A783